jgi:hypothetical protein
MSRAPTASGTRMGASQAMAMTLWQSHYALLLACMVVMVAVQGTVGPSAVQRIAVTALAGASLLLAVRAARARPGLVHAAAALAAAGLAVSVLRAVDGGVGEGAARAANAALLAIGPPAVAVGVVRDLRAEGHVRVEAILGVLSLYMLIGLMFAAIFGVLDTLGSGPIFADNISGSAAHCLYYSFVTLATVGYGDVVTRTNVGHTLSVFEALTGQIYLVTVVSLLVSNLRR